MAGSGLGYEILGAVKVKDGLFIGDELAAQDLEFVVSNKVTRIINTCGRQVPNHWESIGVVYLTYYWVDADNQVILDQRDVVANEIFRFVEEALENAESVLIHSVRGQSRSCCVLSAYMMKKHCWGLRKTMEFLSFRRPDMNLKPAFLQQLAGFERRLMQQADRPFSLDWNDADFSKLESEELLLRNTYINSQMGPIADFHADEALAAQRPRKVMWSDGGRDDKNLLENVCEANPGPQRTILKKVSGGGAYVQPAFAPADPIQQWAMPPPAENPEVQHPQPTKPLLGPGSGTNGAAAAVAAAAAAAAAAGGVYGLGGAGAPMGLGMGMAGPPEVVPTAWGVDGPSSVGMGGPVINGMNGAAVPGLGPSLAYSEAEARQQAQGMFQRGPATNIRDSLQQQRRDSAEQGRVGGGGGGGSRPPSRDPSPKTAPGRRGESPSSRGKPPLRYPSPSGSVRSATQPALGSGYPVAAASLSGRPAMMPAPMTASGYPGFALNGVRAASMPGAVPGTATPPQGGGPPRSMSAYRSGGPVRAKADVLAADGSMRRSRPATAPATRPTNSRPASPLGAAQRSGSQSRPASPHTARTNSAGPPPAAQTQPPPPPSLRTSMQGMSYPHAQTQRSLSGHMRRAPSPTPAFNRNSSPGKPRWRA